MTIPVLNIIHCPVFYLKHDVSESGFCLRFQVGQEAEISSNYWTQLSTTKVPPEDGERI
jgi:hypothetical protein